MFGRVNLIDLAAALCMAVLAGMGGLAYTIVRVRPPIINAVTPAALAPNTPARVQLTGHYFRPYLRAFVARTGAADFRSSARAVELLIGMPTAVELRLPALETGTYDIRLYDGEDQVARRDSAFTVGLSRGSEGF